MRVSKAKVLLPVALAGLVASLATSGYAEPSVDVTRLPVGDGHLSSAPEQGSVWACASGNGGPGGSNVHGPWVNGDGTWDSTKKVTVDGAVDWPDAGFSISSSGGQRRITGNDLPEHTTGVFPVAQSDDAWRPSCARR